HGEPRRDRQTDPRHFGKVRAFAAEQRLHLPCAIGIAIAKIINVARCFFWHVQTGTAFRCPPRLSSLRRPKAGRSFVWHSTQTSPQQFRFLWHCKIVSSTNRP